MSATLDHPEREGVAQRDPGSIGIAPAQLHADEYRPWRWLLPLAATPAGHAPGAAMVELAGYLHTRLRPEPPRLRRR